MARLVERDRAALGLDTLDGPERRSHEAAMHMAERQGLTQPDRAMAIAADVNSSPRPLSDIETSGLNVHAVRLKNEHASLLKSMREAPNDAARLDAVAKLERVDQDLEILTRAMRTSGTEKGRALQSQQRALDDAYNRWTIRARAAEAKGSELTPSEKATLNDLAIKHEEMSKRLAEVEKQLQDQQAEQVIRRHKATYKLTEGERSVEQRVLLERAKELARLGCH